MGDDYESLTLNWESREKNLRSFIKLPYPTKSIAADGYSNLYPDFFYANVVGKELALKHIKASDYKEYLDHEKDPNTKSLKIIARYDT